MPVTMLMNSCAEVAIVIWVIACMLFTGSPQEMAMLNLCFSTTSVGEAFMLRAQ